VIFIVERVCVLGRFIARTLSQGLEIGTVPEQGGIPETNQHRAL
jgi:hypothetical protein